MHAFALPLCPLHHFGALAVPRFDGSQPFSVRAVTLSDIALSEVLMTAASSQHASLSLHSLHNIMADNEESTPLLPAHQSTGHDNTDIVHEYKALAKLTLPNIVTAFMRNLAAAATIFAAARLGEVARSAELFDCLRASIRHRRARGRFTRISDYHSDRNCANYRACELFAWRLTFLMRHFRVSLVHSTCWLTRLALPNHLNLPVCMLCVF